MVSIIGPLNKHKVFKEIETFAQCIWKSFQGEKSLSDHAADFEPYYDCPAFLQYVTENLQVRLTVSHVQDLAEAASCMVKLSRDELWLMEELKLSRSANEFWQLIKISRIYGFDAPCIILCRSAIEDVLRAKVGYEVCERHFGMRRGKQSGFCLADFIEAAKLESILTDDLAKEAHAIRQRANRLIHGEPRLTARTEETIGQTVRIVCMIETGKDPWRPASL